MSNFNAVVGMDQPTLNDLSKQIYNALYPKVFTGKPIINVPLLYAVGYNITRAPEFDLSSSEITLEAIKNSLSLDKADKNLLGKVNDFIETQVAAFTLLINQMTITVFKTKDDTGTPYDAEIEAGCHCNISSDKAFPSIVSAGIKLPGHPALEGLLNKFFMPLLIKTLNILLEDGYQLPPLNFMGASFSPLVARIEDETLTAFAALEPGPSQFPGPYDKWSQYNLFIMFDQDVAKVVTDNKLSTLHASDKPEYKINIGICTLKVDAWYDIGIKDAHYTFNPDNSVSVSVTAYGGGGGDGNCGILKGSPKLKISAQPKVTGKIYIDNNVVIVQFESIDDFKVHLDISGIPHWMEKAVSGMISFFTKRIFQLIGQLLKGLQIPLYSIPTISFTIDGVTLNINLNNQLLSVVTGPVNKILAVVKSEPQVNQ